MLYALKVMQQDGKQLIFCGIRKKYVALTPEEDVRQQTIKYFVENLQYPIKSINVEKRIKVNNINKRFDIVIYNKANPFILVECKASSIKLDDGVLLQVSNYQSLLKANYIFITNGKQAYIWDTTINNWSNTLPSFTSITT
jgi:hypothetical protein